MTTKKLLKWKSEFSKEAKALTEPEIGLKVISTIDHRGWPHLTMISFNKAKTVNQVVWGQFTEGASKKNVRENPKQGIFYMSAERPFKFLQTKVELDYIKHEGEDCEVFSRGAMLRYMTYMNIHTCYYNKVVAATDIRPLGLMGIVKGFLTNIFGKNGMKTNNAEKKIT